MRGWITPGAAILCAVALAVSGWALSDRFHQGTARRQHDTQVLRSYQRANGKAWNTVICYLEALTLQNKQATVDQRMRAIKAYDHILDLVDAPPCR